MQAVLNEKSARVLDILQQIEALNEILQVHHDDAFMREQYEERKAGFAKQLGEVLSHYKIDPGDFAA